MTYSDETNLTEIELAADGRIYLFGTSLEVLELLEASGLGDAETRRRLRLLRSEKLDVSDDEEPGKRGDSES